MKTRLAVALAATAVAVAGCAGNQEQATTPARPLLLEGISLVMAPDANDNWPAQVDLVRVQDVGLATQLLGIETRAWFEKEREAFRQAHPEVFFDSWEVVPGTVVGPERVRVEGPVAGVLFCGTLSGAAVPPPARFERDGEVVVHIGDEGCTLSGGEPSKEPSFWSGWW